MFVKKNNVLLELHSSDYILIHLHKDSWCNNEQEETFNILVYISLENVEYF